MFIYKNVPAESFAWLLLNALNTDVNLVQGIKKSIPKLFLRAVEMFNQ